MSFFANLIPDNFIRLTPYENVLKKLVDIHKSIRDKNNGDSLSTEYCKQLIPYLESEAGNKLPTLRDRYDYNSNILHLIASDVKTGVEENSGNFKEKACSLYDCPNINEIINIAINCIANNQDNLPTFYNNMSKLIDEKAKQPDGTSAKTPEEVLNDSIKNNSISKDSIVNLKKIFTRLREIKGNANAKITSTQTPLQEELILENREPTLEEPTTEIVKIEINKDSIINRTKKGDKTSIIRLRQNKENPPYKIVIEQQRVKGGKKSRRRNKSTKKNRKKSSKKNRKH
jgi:hypothetical protein